MITTQHVDSPGLKLELERRRIERVSAVYKPTGPFNLGHFSVMNSNGDVVIDRLTMYETTELPTTIETLKQLASDEPNNGAAHFALIVFTGYLNWATYGSQHGKLLGP